MTNIIEYKNKKIRYHEQGNGFPIVMLHGFLESLDIWDEFATKIAENYRVILIDLPGHGKTDVFSEIHSMEFMAEVVNQVLVYLNIDKCVMIGHSMGGYVSLAFLENYAHKLTALSLFHSSPFADNEVKKAARDLTIQDIKLGKKIQICKEHAPKTFAHDNLIKFERIIGFTKIIAINTSPEGIIAALQGMKQRKDYSKILENTEIPFLYILGLKDNFIPSNILSFMKIPKNTNILNLQNSGHQGYIEEPEICYITIKNWLENNKNIVF